MACALALLPRFEVVRVALAASIDEGLTCSAGRIVENPLDGGSAGTGLWPAAVCVAGMYVLCTLYLFQ